MQGLDISIDEAKAKIWMDDVNAELAAVRSLLKKVNMANADVAGSDDTIMEGIYKVGVAMGNAWDKMCNVFDEVSGKITDGISKLGHAVQHVVEEAESIRAKIEN